MSDFPDLSENEKRAAKFLEFYNFNKNNFKKMVVAFGGFHTGMLERQARIELFESILNSPSKMKRIREYIEHDRDTYMKYCGSSKIEDNLGLFMKEDDIKEQMQKSCDIEWHAAKMWFFRLHARFTIHQIKDYQSDVLVAIGKREIAKLPQQVRTEAERLAEIVYESCGFDHQKREWEMVEDLYDKMFRNIDSVTPSTCREILRSVYKHRNDIMKEAATKRSAPKRPIIPFDSIEEVYEALKAKHPFNKEYKVTVEDVSKRLLFRWHKTCTMDDLRPRVIQYYEEVLKKDVFFFCKGEDSEGSGEGDDETAEPGPNVSTDDEGKVGGSGAGQPQPGTSKSFYGKDFKQLPRKRKRMCRVLSSSEEETVSPEAKKTMEQTLASPKEETVSPEAKKAMEQTLASPKEETVSPEPPKTTKRTLSFSDDKIVAPNPKQTTKPTLTPSDDQIVAPDPKQTTKPTLTPSDDQIVAPQSKRTPKRMLSSSDDEVVAQQPPKKAKH